MFLLIPWSCYPDLYIDLLNFWRSRFHSLRLEDSIGTRRNLAIYRFTLQLLQLAPKPPLVSGAEDCRDHNPADSVNRDPLDIPRCKYARLPLRCVFFRNFTCDQKNDQLLFCDKRSVAETRCIWDPAFKKVKKVELNELGQFVSICWFNDVVQHLEVQHFSQQMPCLKGVHRYRYTVHRAPRRLRPVWWPPMWSKFSDPFND